MQKTKNNKKSAGSKKETRKQIEIKLETALASLIPLLGEKKFKKRIKKAGKVLSQDLKEMPKTKPSHNAEPKAHVEKVQAQ